jgi:Zn-dependent protease
LNLFNLIPFFGLDGSHGFKALNSPQRFAVAAAFGAAWWLTGFPLMIVPTAVAAFRAFQPNAGPGDARTLANFMGLIGVLGWMSTLRATP